MVGVTPEHYLKHSAVTFLGNDMVLNPLHIMQGPYLAGYSSVDSPPLTYGLERLDHAVGNVHHMQETVDYIAKATGFHQFAEFTAEVDFQAVSPQVNGASRIVRQTE